MIAGAVLVVVGWKLFMIGKGERPIAKLGAVLLAAGVFQIMQTI